MSSLDLGLLFAVGLVAAVLNVVAAGGSFLTLPALMFLGLPAGVANATNRVGVLAQNLSAVAGFHRHRILPLKWALTVSVPAVVGALVGAALALVVPDLALKRALSLVMLITALSAILHKTVRGPARDQWRQPGHWTMVAGFFVTGIYGGFLQAGVGFLSLGLTTFAGMDLVRGNAVKVLAVLLVTLASLAVFAGAGQVHWPAGIALGLGNLVGGAVGVRVTIQQEHRRLEQIIALALIVCAALLWTSD